jgi:two-component system LytT family sensor kinase
MKLTWRTFKWLAIAGSFPPIYFHLRTLFYEDIVATSVFDFVLWFLISISVTIVLAVIVFKEIEWLQKILPWKKYVARRVIAEFVCTVSTVLLGMFILSQFTFDMHCKMFPGKLNYSTHLFEELTTGIVLWAILLSVTEGVYFFYQWRDGLVLSETLQKEKVESQLEALRNQANPHFLFNSLNVLSSLVHTDPDKAEEFIDKFASVYRYVLNIQDKNVVTLKEELDFLNSYLYLQKIRFREGFEINIDINKENYEHFVLPFSLQFMVENALKHNIVSKDSPLKINISLKEDKICVVNNIQLRDNEDESTGMGLKNLQQRYFLLANIIPKYEMKNGEFVVCIPLLKPEKKEEKENIDKDECCNHRRRRFCG